MATKESYFWHKLHSLSGIIPVGFYLVQHLVLNSFSNAGAASYDSVIQFFEGLPRHLLLVLKYGLVWIPLIFHAVYGLFIASRGEYYVSNWASKYRENRYFVWQRWTGIFAFLFLCYHMATTSVAGAIKGAESTIYYKNWADHLSSYGYAIFVLYVLGIVASTYHLSYGIWNFCIRWGITISEASQRRMARFAGGLFLLLSLLGIFALIGFFKPVFAPKDGPGMQEVRREEPIRLANR